MDGYTLTLVIIGVATVSYWFGCWWTNWTDQASENLGGMKMQRHYYAIVAEKHYDRVAMRSECNVAEVGDLVSGSNKTTVYSGYKVITEPRFVLYGTGEDDFLNALYWGDIPQVSKVTRDVWKLEPEKEDASDWSGNAAASGDSGTAVVTGFAGRATALGEQCLAVAWGEDSLARGTVGNWIVVSERDDDGNIIDVKIAKVDGDTVKADTWYKLVNGEIMEA